MKIVKRFVLGSAQTNCFIIEHEEQYMMIDAGENPQKVIDYLGTENIKLNKILITHAHFDHIAGLNELLELNPDTKVYINQQENDYLYNSEFNLATGFGTECIFKYEALPTSELQIKGLEIKEIRGHSLCSSVYVFPQDQTMFTGDTLFNGTIGRSDFINGNQELLIKGIKEEIMSYPSEFIAYPGHGFRTKLANEAVKNNYLR